jgi:WD40 repeat protein
MIYLVMPKLGETSTTVRMMRVRLNGGPPQFILQGPGINNQQCAHLPSRLCLFSEIVSSGEKVYSFDPMNGATKEISVPKSPGEELLPFNWTLSSDGKILARALEKDPSIRFFFLENGTEQKVTLPAWAGVTSIDWAADGKSLWAGAYTNTKHLGDAEYRSERQSSPHARRK